MDIGSIHPTNNGNVEILSYKNAKEVTVKFVATGFTKVTRASHIRNGSIKDPFFPSVYGIGYLGEGIYKATENRKNTAAYDKWQNMLARCYDPKVHAKFPSYKGCTVHADWHNFQVFASWFYGHPSVSNLDLDKDIKVAGNNEYSAQTCLLVPRSLNIEKAHAKVWQFTSPEGNPVTVYNLNEFCRKHGLTRENMAKVHNGKRKSHKQWTK